MLQPRPNFPSGFGIVRRPGEPFADRLQGRRGLKFALMLVSICSADFAIHSMGLNVRIGFYVIVLGDVCVAARSAPTPHPFSHAGNGQGTLV